MRTSADVNGYVEREQAGRARFARDGDIDLVAIDVEVAPPVDRTVRAANAPRRYRPDATTNVERADKAGNRAYPNRLAENPSRIQPGGAWRPAVGRSRHGNTNRKAPTADRRPLNRGASGDLR